MLVERLLRSAEPVTAVVAPPGYGKTTLLAQWAERFGPRVAWISCERSDNDPVALWTGIIDALDRIAPVGDQARALLAVFGGGVDVVPGLVATLSKLPAPVLVVLDHLESITSPQCRTSIAEFAFRVPDGWQLAVSSRDALPLPLSRLRVGRRIVEVGVDQLAMGSEEAAALLRLAGAEVSAAETDELVRRTEGWPAGLYLAALAIQSGSPATGFSFTGDDRLVDDYLHTELLTRLPRGQAEFLVKTSLLDRMNGPLCDAVVGGKQSARMLEELERRNLLVVPLDRHGEWYRYHHLLRDLLRADLRRGDPDLVRAMHTRAADWYEANGLAEAAIEHADAAADTERATRLVLELMQPVWASGRVDTVRAWLQLLDKRPRAPQYTAVAAHGALIFALLGRVREAERWVGVAESLPVTGTLSDGSTVAATLAYMRANLGRAGPAAMRTDSVLALEGLSSASPFRATMLHCEALSWMLEGDHERADAGFTHAYDVATGFDILPLTALILVEQSLLAFEQDEQAAADALLKRAVDIVDTGRFDGYWTSALVFASAAQAAVRRGEMRAARQYVRRAAALRPLLTYALPAVSVQALLELARAYLTLVDPDGARAVLEQAQNILRRRPDLGTLPAAVRKLRTRVDQITVAAAAGASSLTTAELRLVQLLPTHLSFPEIADRLYVSPNTIKSQAKSVYRKLGVSSRGQAVKLMAEWGM
ncbi:LuxR C-terminal-related transcriptional regulator [Kribbella amoyensis]|uniref:LuxR C-terminal-related transcriptional regulator n=1 Tax=Kribbella amoyensis TaxID=996641 RepID=UPI00119D5780|nr:LuxR C-terminal-related transcriptional regulator [Kribbella amoyensis]